MKAKAGATWHNTAHVFPDCVIGENCRIGARAVIGSVGLIIRKIVSGDEANLLERIKSEGIVIVEDNVDIGANTTIHRGRDDDTIIGKGSFIGPMCNIGHNVKIGKNCMIGTQSLLCGHVEVGDGARINPGSTIKNRIKIGSYAVVGIGSLVMKDVPDGVTVVGRPAIELKEFRRRQRRLKKLLNVESQRR